MNILHIDSGILGEHSVSRRLTAAVIERLRAEHPEATIVTHDLVTEPVGHLTGADLGAAPAGRCARR